MVRFKQLSLCILAIFLAGSSILAQTKGIKVIPIKNASGRQVGLYKGSYALVIGISDYTVGWPKLPSVINETKEIQLALQSNGFLVERVLNPDSDGLKKVFEEFIKKYGYDQDNRLLFFFSGHGYSRKKGTKGYLVPSNAPDPRKDEKGFLRTALPMSQLLAWSRQMEAKHALFIFDSCFSGTIFKTKALPEIPPHISAVTSRPVRQFISAGDAGEEIPARSVFARCFLRALQGEADLSMDGYVTGSELGMYLRDKVLHYQTGQTPQYGKIRDPDLDQGDFVFVVVAALRLSPRSEEEAATTWGELKLTELDLPQSFEFAQITEIKQAARIGLTTNPGFVDVDGLLTAFRKEAVLDQKELQLFEGVQRWYIAMLSHKNGSIGYMVLEYRGKGAPTRLASLILPFEPDSEEHVWFQKGHYLVISSILDAEDSRSREEMRRVCASLIRTVQSRLEDLTTGTR